MVDIVRSTTEIIIIPFSLMWLRLNLWFWLLLLAPEQVPSRKNKLASGEWRRTMPTDSALDISSTWAPTATWGVSQVWWVPVSTSWWPNPWCLGAPTGLVFLCSCRDFFIVVLLARVDQSNVSVSFDINKNCWALKFLLQDDLFIYISQQCLNSEY